MLADVEPVDVRARLEGKEDWVAGVLYGEVQREELRRLFRDELKGHVFWKYTGTSLKAYLAELIDLYFLGTNFKFKLVENGVSGDEVEFRVVLALGIGTPQQAVELKKRIPLRSMQALRV